MIGSNLHDVWAAAKFSANAARMLYQALDNGGWQPLESGS
jgi:hypothetical protein